jgi:hypothetical protein
MLTILTTELAQTSHGLVSSTDERLRHLAFFCEKLRVSVMSLLFMLFFLSMFNHVRCCEAPEESVLFFLILAIETEDSL